MLEICSGIPQECRRSVSTVVMAKAYKEKQQSRKHTRSTRNIHTDNMQEIEPIYYFFSMKYGGVRIRYYISVHAHIGC